MTLSTNCVAAWIADNDTGTTMVDEVGSNDGTYGSGASKTASGKINDGWSLTSSEISIPNSSTWDFGTGDFTFAFWIKTTTASFSYVFARGLGGGTGNPGYGINIGSDGKFQAIISDDTRFFGSKTTSAWNDGNWHLVIVEFDRDANMVVYVDNTSEASDNISARSGSVSSSKNLYVGSYNNGDAFNITADFDEISMWNRLLTTQEKTDLYNAGAGFQYPFSGGSSPSTTSGTVLMLGSAI